MSLILQLRDRTTHAGVPLVHPTSENVVLSDVFGVVKNLAFDGGLNPWLLAVSGGSIAASNDWRFSFWESQPCPVGVHEGSTEVDLVLSSEADLVFVEVKMDAAPSAGTTHDPDRNQLVRNLDIGNRRAAKDHERFSVVYITPDMEQPGIVEAIRATPQPFPTDRLYWSSWSTIGDVLAASLSTGSLNSAELRFTLDLLANLAKKRLWRNVLADDESFYRDKLLKPLRRSDSPFVPYAVGAKVLDQSWRQVDWDEDSLRALLRDLRWEDKALLRLLADAGGAMRQREIMQRLPQMEGKSSRSLALLKSHVNAACKGCGRAPILSVGTGSGDNRLHEINPALKDLRQVVIDESLAFVLPDGLS